MRAEINALTTTEDKLKHKLHSSNVLFSQEEEANKFEINHEEKFKQFYSKLLKKNQDSLHNATPEEKNNLQR